MQQIKGKQFNHMNSMGINAMKGILMQGWKYEKANHESGKHFNARRESMKMQGISKNTISYGISNPVKNCVLESVSNIFFTLQGDPTKMGYLKKTRLRKPYGIIEQLFFFKQDW